MNRDSSTLLQFRLSKRIAERRRQLHLTQAELAERVGVDTETISRFERGKYLPSLLCLERLALELNTSMGALLDDINTIETTALENIMSQSVQLNKKDLLFFTDIASTISLHLLNKSQEIELQDKTRQDKTRQDKTRQDKL
jgi:transcriptional regulator with XRE-family HTH domain